MNDKSITVLLVEDDDIDAEAVTRGFKKHNIGNRIVRVQDGIEALDALKGRNGHVTVRRPYLILLDINMPRMNGLEFLEAVREDEELKDSVVFMLTTSESQHDRRAAYDLQVAGYMHKNDVGPTFLKAASMLDQYSITVTLPE